MKLTSRSQSMTLGGSPLPAFLAAGLEGWSVGGESGKAPACLTRSLNAVSSQRRERVPAQQTHRRSRSCRSHTGTSSLPR